MWKTNTLHFVQNIIIYNEIMIVSYLIQFTKTIFSLICSIIKVSESWKGISFYKIFTVNKLDNKRLQNMQEVYCSTDIFSKREIFQ